MAPVSDERLAELTNKLETGIRELYASGRYAEYLAAMSQFHHYSFGNALLILFQFPTVSRVAGYNTWKKLGRQVKRYEKGIKILAPCPYQRAVEQEQKDPETGQTLYGPDGKPLRETCYMPATHFKVATVFDISQTEGRELPNIGVSELSGDVADFSTIYTRLKALSPLPVEEDHVPGTAKGYTSFIEQRIVLRPGMSQAQTIKTLVHEIAHAKLHAPDILEGEQRPRREKEVEAESGVSALRPGYLGILLRLCGRMEPGAGAGRAESLSRPHPLRRRGDHQRHPAAGAKAGIGADAPGAAPAPPQKTNGRAWKNLK